MAYNYNYNPSNPAQVADARESIRTAIFTAKPKSKIVDAFGIKMEIRQPSLKVILESQNVSAEERNTTIALMLVKYAFVPGTTERIFDDVDVDSILGLPFGEDMQAIQDAMNELVGIQKAVEDAKGNLPKT